MAAVHHTPLNTEYFDLIWIGLEEGEVEQNWIPFTLPNFQSIDERMTGKKIC